MRARTTSPSVIASATSSDQSSLPLATFVKKTRVVALTLGRVCASWVQLIWYSKVPASSEVTSRDPDAASGPAQPGVPPTPAQTE